MSSALYGPPMEGKWTGGVPMHSYAVAGRAPVQQVDMQLFAAAISMSGGNDPVVATAHDMATTFIDGSGSGQSA